jgi:hypothetical protein
MSSRYFYAANTDSGMIIACEHQHATVTSAVACIASAGGYVVAVQKGRERQLNNKEEREFQEAMYGIGSPRRRFVRVAAARLAHTTITILVLLCIVLCR